MTHARTAADSYLTAASHCLPTETALRGAGLPAGALASIQLDLVRLSPAGKWHPVPAGGPGSCCPVVRRAAAAGRELTRQRAGMLDDLALCRTCTAQIRLPGLPGAYLMVVRYVIAARRWLDAFEAAAVRDWPAWVRWTARTPLGVPLIPPAIAALTRDQAWREPAAAAQAAWSGLARRAAAASDLAREAAGQPGLPDHAAAACAIAGAHQDTYPEAHLLSAISAPGSWDGGTCGQGWQEAARAWAGKLRLDADLDAARSSLASALELVYRDAPVRDMSLLPPPARYPGAGFATPADWADAEYRALRQAIAGNWAQRLEEALAGVIDHDENAASRWRLLLITGWPLTAGRDQDLAYLARYPELDRVDVRPEIAVGDRERIIRATVLLHVPGFAARHAVAHASPFFRASAGALLPRGVNPAPSQVAELVQQAVREHAPGHPARRA